MNLCLAGFLMTCSALYPESIPTDAPAYMMAWAVGDYTYSMLGVTSNGTEVGVYYLPGQEENAFAGTQYLRDVFDWYEQTYGEYAFGSKVASVSVDWLAGGFGGMEHHPSWHIEDDALSDPVVHAHEAVSWLVWQRCAYRLLGGFRPIRGDCLLSGCAGNE